MDYINSSFIKLKEYCEKEDFKGWDPYDGLNSRFFQAVPFFKDNGWIRLLWIQSFKRFPYNLRQIFLVEKGYNPKGLALLLSGYCNLYRIEQKREYLDKIYYLIEKILSLQSQGWSGSCWGYNFDWQARAFYQPRYTPTVVVSTFVGCALLDAFDILKEKRLVKTAGSICDFILKDLNRTYDEEGNFAFSYSPQDKTVIFNASLFGSKMLTRVYSYIKEKSFIEEAKRSVEFCCRYQREDGSWSYGLLPYHQWVDSFHTGYNLESLWEYETFSGDRGYHINIEKGLLYYINTFFTAEGIPRYYNDSVYPIDVHSAAQLVVTLYKLAKFKENEELANKVLSWVIENMQDEGGFFYYQIRRGLNCKIPYMRWAQTWMFYAMSLYLEYINSKNEN